MSTLTFKKSILLALLVCASLNIACDSGTGRKESSAKTEVSLNEKIYALNYAYAHKGGIEAAKEDREKNRAYEPELILAQPIFQALIKWNCDKVVEMYGETYRQDAEKGFRDGFMAGYKEGYK